MPWTLEQAVAEVARLIDERQPTFFITANLHYAMLTERDPLVRTINQQAAFLLADGMPFVWASRAGKVRLPERVPGSDLIFALSKQAAARGHRIFFLGGQPGVAAQAAANLQARYPGLVVAGIEAPPFRPLSVEENAAMVKRIREARPDLLFVAFGQPKGERWIAENLHHLGVPVSVQLGASIDFAAGRVRRAPQWIQRVGMEWAFRLYLEPRRLAGRYAKNATFLLRRSAQDWRRAERN
ncbi:MAG: WecB/TagA/CpsF family glycosyltransferase [Gemmataceae bacterium]